MCCTNNCSILFIQVYSDSKLNDRLLSAHFQVVEAIIGNWIGQDAFIKEKEIENNKKEQYKNKKKKQKKGKKERDREK